MSDLFDGISPGFGPFSSVFDDWVGIIISLVWAFAFIFCAVNLILGIGAVAAARRQHRSDGEGTLWRILWPIGGLVGLVLVPVIYAAIVAPPA